MPDKQGLCTTFALAYKAGVRMGSYRKLAKSVGGIPKYGRDAPLPLSEILTVCGLSDALWSFRCVFPRQQREAGRVLYSFLADVLERIQDKMLDDRSKAVIPMLRRRAAGLATADELERVRRDAADAFTAVNADDADDNAVVYNAVRAAIRAADADADAPAAAATVYDDERAWQMECLRQHLIPGSVL